MSEEKGGVERGDQRAQRLHRELSGAPLVLLSGVVDGTGPSGVSLEKDAWTFRVTLAAWRIEGGALEMRPLAVRRDVARDELRSLTVSFAAYEVLRMRARVLAEASRGGAHALLEELVGIEASDPDLDEAAAQLAKPVTFDDARFGTFTLDRRVGWFTAQTDFCGARIRLNLSATEDDDVQAALAAARTFFADAHAWNDRVRAYALEKLLPLKNGNWLRENEAELTPDDFLAKMKLESITIEPDGAFELWHDDGELFGGHAIQVSGTLTDGPNDADIPG